MNNKSQEEHDRQLLGAVRARDLAAAQDCLARGANPAARLEDTYALFAAMENNDPAMIRLLAPRVAHIDTTDACDFSIFTHAVRKNLAEAAETLLECGASPFPPGRGAEYALDWAVANKMYGVITAMLKASGFPNRAYKDEPLLVHAVRNDDLPLAEACLAGGVDINRGERKHGYTALHVAAREGNEMFMRWLITRGARADVTANGTQTPFDWAGGHETTLRRIVNERDMKEAARALKEGLPENLRVRPPVRFRKFQR